MGRNRVLSFMSQLSGTQRDSKTPTPTSSPPHYSPFTQPRPSTAEPFREPPQPAFTNRFSTPSSNPTSPAIQSYESPVNSPARERSTSRPLSMVQAYQPPVMDITEDTIPELQPIFTFLNSHANKLYQEGYFLKLDDQNTQGRPNPDRTWTEYFAQLVGTVLSLWDAAELDAAGEDGEVLPKFINLTDASIKMIESLPTRSNDSQPLQNILSISTAGRNRYLLHFNSHHSLIQWTAGIRLAMFEHTTLQEAYTGALIAGKGKTLNNINLIMDRTRAKSEEWVRVRFGAGVPWRRCWCVVSPPDEKEYLKLQKDLKKRSPYDRSHVPLLKGDIRFYDTKKDGKKQKKVTPIASITDAYASYAIYPQAKSLIDGSTLLKIEGNITIHSAPPSSAEGFVFIMPETHPAVTGFEMLLRFLFPTWDTFALYGRPGRLVASVLDPRSLMFAMPKHKRYGYLEILDVTGLILMDGSATWTEREWRKRLKDLTGQRMNAMEDGSKTHSRSGSRRSNRLSFGGSSTPIGGKPRVGFTEDSASGRPSRPFAAAQPSARTDSAPPPMDRERAPPVMPSISHHMRNSSDPHIVAGGPPAPDYDGPYMKSSTRGPVGVKGILHDRPGMSEPMSSEEERVAMSTPVRNSSDPHIVAGGPPAPDYDGPYMKSSTRGPVGVKGILHDRPGMSEPMSSEEERVAMSTPVRELEDMRRLQTPEPVSRPPAFNHGPQSRPGAKAYHSPELRRANSRLSSTTLSQIAKSGGVAIPRDHFPDETSRRSGEENAQRGPPVHPYANPVGISANDNRSREALISPISPQSSPGGPQSAASTASGRALPQHSQAPPGGQPRKPAPNFQPQPRGNPYEPRSSPLGQPPQTNVQMQQPQQTGNYRPDNPRHIPPDARSHHQPRYPPGHGQGPLYGVQKPNLDSLDTAHPAHRKPIAGRSTGPRDHEAKTPQSASSSESFKTNFLDQGAMDQVRHQDPNKYSPMPDRRLHRQGSDRSGTSSHYTESRPANTPLLGLNIHRQDSERSGAGGHYPEDKRGPVSGAHFQRQDSGKSSQYSDGYSTASPDYASTRKSNETAASVERPRAGVLRTVGGAEPPLPTTHPNGSHYNVPQVDFGPTANYGARPLPNKKPAPPGHQPGNRVAAPGRNSPAPEPAYDRQEVDDKGRRMVAWQPGGTVAGYGGGQGMSPEQFVQQRAAAGATPLHAHGRTPSGNTLAPGRSTTPTPTMSRTVSDEQMLQRHSRSSSAELLQRPGSRGANSSLNLGSAGEMSSHLSAREQEHVARVTGSPLINMATTKAHNPPGGGLVGAIEAREREKQQIKHGVNNQAVQHAINQRQFHLQPQAQPQAYHHQQMLPGVPLQGTYHGHADQGYGQPGPPRQQPISPGAPGGPPSFMSPLPPTPPAHGPGAGFSRPGARPPQGRQSPQTVDPRFLPPQGQYSPGDTRQGNRGPGFEPSYQGQAF